jgi:hypothetical protein
MAAGLGFKDFVTGEVLTAADVDGYLMQGVWVFASAAARDAAVTSPQEGNFAYLKDTNVTTYYTGSAWANLDTTGMTNPMTTTGDTIYSSSGSTPARLGIGTTGQVLTVAGGVPSWATPAGGGGKVLQVVQASTSTGVTIASTSYTDSGLSASITPSSASSQVLVIVSQAISMNRDAQEMYNVSANLLRGASQITELPNFFWFRLGGNSDTALKGTYSLIYLDGPATTSSVTYKTQGKCEATANNQTVRFQSGSVPSTLTLLEIGA